MKKVFLFFAVALMAVCSLTLVSCGDDSNNSEPEQVVETYIGIKFGDEIQYVGNDYVKDKQKLLDELETFLKSKYAFTKTEKSYFLETVYGYTTSNKEAEVKAAMAKVTDAELEAVCEKVSGILYLPLEIFYSKDKSDSPIKKYTYSYK